VVPKRPLAERKTSLSTSVGSEGLQRHTFETSGPLTRSLRYRFGLAKEERDDWTDFRTKDLEYAVGQLEYQPSDALNILFEYQWADTMYGGTGTQSVYDNLGERSFGGQLRNIYNEQLNWARDVGGKGPEYRISGADTYEQREEYNTMLNVDIVPFEGLSINFGGYWGSQETERLNVKMATVNNQESNLFVKRRIRIPTNPPQFRTIIQYVPDDKITAFENPTSPIFNDTTDFKSIRYYWEKDPQMGEFAQYRGKVNYEFETAFIGGPAQHSLLIGRHDIKDTIDYAQGTERLTRLFEPNNLARPGFTESTTDSLIFKNIYDFTPVTYNGELTAQPGREYHQTDIWYQGSYAVYQGRFWDDKIMLIAGGRYDRYQALEKEYERDNGNSGVIMNPENVTTGFLSEQYNFGEPVTINTNTFALRYDIRDDFSFYALAAEGVSPNTGALDGNDDFIDAEQSLSKEFGFKFELMEGKLSGTISAYQIDRENAIWNFAFAPNPGGWVGGSNEDGTRGRDLQDFNPAELESGLGKLSYGVDSSYFDPADIARDPATFAFPAGIISIESQHNGTPNPQNYVYLDYAQLDASGFRDEIERAFADVGKSRALNSSDINPIFYTRTSGTYYGLNPSGVSGGANVTFGDRAEGVDFQVIYSPRDNWQMIINYAHTERTVTTPFQLVGAIDQVTGVEYGTEYDSWVRALGRGAFGLEEVDNNGDGIPDQILKDGQPVSLTNIVSAASATGGIENTNLFFGAEDEGSIWNKYTFDSGPLRRLSILFGARYTGPQETAVRVGGTDLAANLYPTPPTEARMTYDAGLVYTKKFGDYQWRFAVNVYNLMDDQKDYTEASYANVLSGGTELRRSAVYHAPRSFRFSARVTF